MKITKIRTDSILRLAIISSFALLLATAAATAGDPGNAFAQDVLGPDVSLSTLSVTGDLAQVCKTILGETPTRAVNVYHSLSNGTVWVLSAKGKHGPVIAGFAVKDGRIKECRVLDDKERHGGAIRSHRYLKQFIGLGLGDDDTLDRKVDSVTRATMSSGAVKKMAHLALTLERKRKKCNHSTAPQTDGDRQRKKK